jgi:DNA repair exonuclease SbcCD ATPase subunit
MKEIKIRGVLAEGFRSLLRDVELCLDRPGLNLVKGENGTGKTTIFEALVWCLYGTNLKDTTVDKIPSWVEIRDEGWRGTMVIAEAFIDDELYSFTRSMDWQGGHGVGKNDFKIEKTVKGKLILVSVEGKKKEAQALADDLLGMDSQTFTNSILFGQRMAKLVESDNSDKRDLFEKLFETAFIKGGKINAVTKLDELEKKSMAVEATATGLENLIENQEDELERNQDILDGFNTSKEEECARITTLIENATNLQVDYQELKKTDQSLVDSWDEKAYQKRLDEFEQGQEEYNKADKECSVKELAFINANDYCDTQLSVIRLANTAYTDGKNIIEKFGVLKAGNVANLQLKLQTLLNDQTKELNEVDKICPECEQDLPEERILTVQDKIKLRYTKAMAEMDEAITIAKDAEPPEINVIKLKKGLTTARAKSKDLDIISDKAKTAFEDAGTLFTSLHTSRQQESAELEELIDEGGRVTEAETSLQSIDNDIEQAQTKADMLSTQLLDKLAEQPPELNIESLEKELKNNKERLEELDAEYTLLDEELKRVKWWVKTGFAAGGLPAYIFKSMLDQLNLNVQQYADRLGVSVEFSIDLDKVSKPFTTNCSVGDKRNKGYKEFSGGQKQRLDIVLIFGMHDLVSYDSNINILILDEIFEGLDEAGEAAVFDLVRTKAEAGKSIYVITHSPHIDSLYSSTIEVTGGDVGATTLV